jgi:Carbohydrate esterase, sialic acid-specific acetylesterase
MGQLVRLILFWSTTALLSGETTFPPVRDTHENIFNELTTPISGLRQSRDVVKVFLLAGQSNMVGMASMDHMDLLVRNTSSPMYKTLWDVTSRSYIVRQDVFMKYLHNVTGPLTLGSKSGYADNNCFGPELMFGWTVGDYYNSNGISRVNILLLKYSYDGQSLAVDFRPPSSGTANYEGKTSDDYGRKYRKMMAYYQSVLSDLDNELPSSFGGKYEINGFVWFQGWADMQDTKKVKEYEQNLINFVTDIRSDLNLPDLPFGT